MKIYHYHPITKEYLGEGYADESPLEPGVWLIPAHATEISPNFPIKPNEVSIFKDHEWINIIDRRGIYYNIEDGSEFINEDPFNIPKNYTKDKPPEVPNGYKLFWDNGWKTKFLSLEERLSNAGISIDELKFAILQ